MWHNMEDPTYYPWVPGNSLEIVKNEFRAKFSSITGNKWENRDKFTQVAGKYTLVVEDTTYGMMMMR